MRQWIKKVLDIWIVAHIARFEDADQRPTKVGKSDKARLAESLGEKSGENSG